MIQYTDTISVDVFTRKPSICANNSCATCSIHCEIKEEEITINYVFDYTHKKNLCHLSRRETQRRSGFETLRESDKLLLNRG